jgi:hypothetical protein
MIEKYSFGSIVIEGKEYNLDVEVRWTGEVLKWWRKEGHTIDIEDVERAVEQNPDTIVIGTGAFGICKVKKDCQEFIKRKRIKLIVDNTGEAVKIFNNLSQELVKEEQEGKIIGLFHLTC